MKEGGKDNQDKLPTRARAKASVAGRGELGGKGGCLKYKDVESKPRVQRGAKLFQGLLVTVDRSF